MVLHNPNNWHWVDKNCLPWAKEYFEKELIGVTAEGNGAQAAVKAVKSVEGDVEVCQRKGKVISLFDIKLELTYEGKVGETAVTGQIAVPEVSYDNDEDDYQFQITIDEDNAEKALVKTLVRQRIVPLLRKKLAAFGKDLIETHGGGIQHTGQEPIHWAANSKPGQSSSSTTLLSGSGQKSAKKNAAAPKVFGVAGSGSYSSTTSVDVSATFTASPEQIFQALITPQQVAIWSRSAPQLEAKVGGKFALFGGNVTGEILELNSPTIIRTKWRLRDWKLDHYAEVTHKLTVGDNETVMDTKWTGVPVGQEEVVQNNFEDYYVKPIKVSFGYGLV